MSESALVENFFLHYPNMRIGRSVLKSGDKIPIHVHTNQFGFGYLLKGKCIISTYEISDIGNESFSLVLTNKQTLTAGNYSILTPKINAHQIDVIEDSIFLDIFAPGKAEGMPSDYLKIIKTDEDGKRLIGKKVSIEDVELPASVKEGIGSYLVIS